MSISPELSKKAIAAFIDVGDKEATTYIITGADDLDDYYVLHLEEPERYESGKQSGSCLMIEKVEGLPTPKDGDVAICYGKGFGYPVRGVYINGEKWFYRTKEEEKQRHLDWVAQKDKEDREAFEKDKVEYFARIAALPKVFQERIERFQKGNADFDVKYGGYELFCCEQAVVIASELKTEGAIDEWCKLPYDKQKELPGFKGEQHSGNTMGCAVSLARIYLKQPEFVAKMHGAMVPLTGCKDYGCTHDH